MQFFTPKEPSAAPSEKPRASRAARPAVARWPYRLRCLLSLNALFRLFVVNREWDEWLWKALSEGAPIRSTSPYRAVVSPHAGSTEETPVWTGSFSCGSLYGSVFDQEEMPQCAWSTVLLLRERLEDERRAKLKRVLDKAMYTTSTGLK